MSVQYRCGWVCLGLSTLGSWWGGEAKGGHLGHDAEQIQVTSKRSGKGPLNATLQSSEPSTVLPSGSDNHYAAGQNSAWLFIFIGFLSNTNVICQLYLNLKKKEESAKWLLAHTSITPWKTPLPRLWEQFYPLTSSLSCNN